MVRSKGTRNPMVRSLMNDENPMMRSMMNGEHEEESSAEGTRDRRVCYTLCRQYMTSTNSITDL